MTFDETISSDVCLSQVLGAFLLEDEKPEVIVEFLKQHDDSFKDIVRDSCCFAKMFQLDWLFKCHEPEIEFSVSHLKKIPLKVAAYFAWQICKSESKVSDRLKYRLRNELSWILGSKSLHHPYGRSMIGKSSAVLDQWFFNVAKHDAICDIPRADNFTLEMFRELMTGLNHSLFRERILQLDFFMACNEIQKFILVKELPNVDDAIAARFIEQVFMADVSTEIKREICKHVARRNWFNDRYEIMCPGRADEQSLDPSFFLAHCTLGKEHVLEMMESCDSFSELLMKMTLEGELRQDLIAMCLLFSHEMKFLKSWLEVDRDGLDSRYKISDVVESILAEEING